VTRGLGLLFDHYLTATTATYDELYITSP